MRHAHYRQLPAYLWTLDEFVDWWVYWCKVLKIPTSTIISHYFAVFGIKDSAIFTAVVDTLLLETGYRIGWRWMLK